MTDPAPLPELPPERAGWPPALPTGGRSNSTPQQDQHPADHNLIADALATIVGRSDEQTAAHAALSATVDFRAAYGTSVVRVDLASEGGFTAGPTPQRVQLSLPDPGNYIVSASVDVQGATGYGFAFCSLDDFDGTPLYALPIVGGRAFEQSPPQRHDLSAAWHVFMPVAGNVFVSFRAFANSVSWNGGSVQARRIG